MKIQKTQKRPRGKQIGSGHSANLLGCLGVALFLFLLIPSIAQAGKVVILGIDGLDPRLLNNYRSQGLLPNFNRLIEKGDFKPLQTTMAPQSPVAWSTFITGMDPGGHGIFDFIHRDPLTMSPYKSISRAVPAERSLSMGSWVVPLSSGKVELLREGRAFWEFLGEKGIKTTIFRMPVNFPPVKVPKNKSLSGMGTPDILGTSGTFSLFTERLPENYREFTGGVAYQVEVVDNRVIAQLNGPPNPFRRVHGGSGGNNDDYAQPPLTIDFTVYIDPQAKAAKFVVDVDGHEFILKEGEWSDWVRVDFSALPWLVDISSVGRFYLKQLDPYFELYVSPLQINPKDPAMPISSPSDWSKQLCSCVNYFYTQEFPEDTKAFTYGVFSGRAFWDQSMFIYEERLRALKHILETDDFDLLFFYIMTVDRGSHMLWRYMDEQHPGFQRDEFLIHGIRGIYQKMDEVLGYVMKGIPEDTTLIVMSDHGFAPFYWEVNLNTWLAQKGYISGAQFGQKGYFPGVLWSRTKAYALGLNGLYVNLQGREKNGTVLPAEYDALLDQLEKDLLEMVDPRTGHKPVSLVTRTHRDFNGPNIDRGPDIIVGYSWGYRSSWKSPLGEFPKEVFVDNIEPWSGDHCIDNRLVPGVLITNNRKITLDRPALYDLTVAVLDEFNVPPSREMIGKDCLAPFTKSEERNTSNPSSER